MFKGRPFFITPREHNFKGSDRLCTVVERVCNVADNFFRIYLRHIKIFKDM